MKKRLIIFILVFSIYGFNYSQMYNKNEKLKVPDKNHVDESMADFKKKYSLENKTPIKMKLTESFSIANDTSCKTKSSQTIIPANAVVYVYKYFPKYKSWASNYKGEWGFIPADKLYAFSKHTVDFSKYDTPPKLRGEIKLKYPKEAEENNISGSVSLRIYISKIGKVTKIKVKEGNSILNPAAIEAVENATFKPAKYKGKNIGVWIPITIEFK